MRRLMTTLMTVLLVGCTPFQSTQNWAPSQIDTEEVIDELSFRAKIQWFLIENEMEIDRMLAKVQLSIPDIVAEATIEDRKSIDCLAKNIYWEASNEPVRGKKAVAQVTVNRTADERFPADICGVVYERDRVTIKGRTKTICQFSWTCMAVRNKPPRNEEQWNDAVRIAQKFVLDSHQLPELEEALFYHADYVRPRWAKQMVKIEKIGAHIFYREKEKRPEIYLASNT